MDLIGQVVVLDTQTSFVYIGTLKDADDYFFTLANVDVSDMMETHSPKEKYILDTIASQHHPTRKLVYVLADKVISLSRLKDVGLDLDVIEGLD